MNVPTCVPLNELQFWLEILKASMPILTGLLIYLGARFAIRNKQADLIIHFHKQFDEIQKQRAVLLVQDNDPTKSTEGFKHKLPIEAHVFFDRFWSLQFDQFVAWYDGYVPSHLYQYWLFSRWRELRESSKTWTIANQTIASSFADVASRWASNRDPKSD